VQLSILLTCLQQTGVATAEPSENPPCNGLASHFSDDPGEWLQAARIIGDDRAYFRWQLGSECLTEPINQCRTPAQSYLIRGDRIVVTGSVPGYVCVAYSKTAHEPRQFFGWIPAAQVEVEKPGAATSPLHAWIGIWRQSSATISLRADGELLHAVGKAIWQGRSAPHFGAFDHSAHPVGNTLTMGMQSDPDGCQIQLILLGELLAASDNQHCGGNNVSFTGFYARKAK